MSENKIRPLWLSVKGFFLFFLALLLIVSTNFYDFLLFHVLAEWFSILIGGTVFVLVWNARFEIDNRYFLFIGTGIFSVVIFDIFHTLSYEGMGLFEQHTANLPTQLWIAGRYVQTFVFLGGFFLIKRKVKPDFLFALFLALTAGGFLSIFYWDIFPDCYIPGKGLTHFKIISEYIISFLLLFTAFLFYRKRRHFAEESRNLIISALIFMAASEILFTFYIDIYGISNVFGHIFKIIAFYLIYRAIIQQVFLNPAQLLYKNLKSRKDFTEGLIQTAPLLILVLDQKGRIEFLNDFAQTLLGYSLYQLRGSFFLSLIPQGDRERVSKALDSSGRQEEGEISFFESRVLGKTIQPDIQWHVKSFQDKTEGESSQLLIGQDITLQKQANSEILRLSRAVEQAENGIVITDPRGQIQYTNPAVEAMTGYSFEELKGKNPRLLKSGQHTKDFYRDLWKTIRQGKKWEGIIQNKRKDGSLYWEQNIISPILDANNQISEFVAIKEDVTEKWQLQEALRKSEQFLRAIYNSVYDAILLHNEQGVILDVNDKMLMMYGVTREKAIGKKVNDFSSPENEFEKLPGMWAKVMQGETRLFEWKAKRYHDGFEFDVEVFLRKLDLPGDSVILATVRDITEKKQARLALQKAHDELEEKVEERTVDLARAVRILREEIRERKRLEKEKEKIQSQLFQSQKMEAVGKLAGGVAHDFNNLIGIIQGYATLLIDELKENPDSGKYLNEILKAAKSSEKLINQLLVFSRQKEIQKEKIVLNSLIKDMMGMLRPILGEQIELETDFQPDLFPVYGDVTNFEQIILNLAVNARDAMEETGGSIRIETRNVEFNDKNLPGIQGLNPGQYVKMVFSDTGSGMSEETLQHVFEPFFTTKAEGKGTGLGLAVIYSIVRNHRGIVYVESETGKGTRFYFYFPAYGDVR